VFFLSSKAFDEDAQGYKEMQASHMPRKAGYLRETKRAGLPAWKRREPGHI